MSDSHQRVMKSVEKCLMEELRKGVDVLKGKTEFVLDCPSITVVATLQFVPKPTNIPMLIDNRVDNSQFVGGNAEDLIECQKQTEYFDTDNAIFDVGLVPSNTVCLHRFSSSLTKSVLEKMIVDEIQPDGFSVTLQSGQYADAKFAFIKFESVIAASEAKLKLDNLMAVHKEKGDQSVFKDESLIGFQVSKVVYVGMLSDLTTKGLLSAEGEKLDGFIESTLHTFCDNFYYGLLHFRTTHDATEAISKLKKLKAQYREDGFESIFIESTVFRFGIPIVPNPQGFCVVHADCLKSGVTKDQLLSVVINKLKIYDCLGVNLTSSESANFSFDSPEGASWGFSALKHLQTCTANDGYSVFTPESTFSWPKI